MVGVRTIVFLVRQGIHHFHSYIGTEQLVEATVHVLLEYIVEVGSISPHFCFEQKGLHGVIQIEYCMTQQCPASHSKVLLFHNTL